MPAFSGRKSCGANRRIVSSSAAKQKDAVRKRFVVNRLSRRLNGPKLNRKKTKLRLIKSRCCLTAFG